MRTGTLDDKDYTIVIVQNVEEARIVGSDQLIDHTHSKLVVCRECRRTAYCSPDSLEIARPNPYPVCIGCLGEAAKRFDNLDARGSSNFVNLAETYRRELEKHRRHG
jgi:hypothetical protein